MARLSSATGTAGRFSRRAGLALVAVGLTLIARATLTSSPDPNDLTALTPLWCLVCGDHGGADIAANLLLFLPFAIGVRLTGVSWRRTVLLSAAVSFGVELLQLVAITGRDASLSDVLTNTVSGALGATIATNLRNALRPSPSQASRLLTGAASVWVAAMGLSAWLLSPSLANGGLWSGWAGVAEGRDIFFGGIRTIRLNGRAMPQNGPAPDSAALRRGLAQGRFAFEAELVSGPPVPYPSWIYKLKAGSKEALTLYQRGRQAGISVPARGVELLARPVTVALPDGFPDAAGVPVRVQASVSGGVVRLRSTYAGVDRSLQFGLSPAYGWRLVSPFDMGVGAGVRWFTALCLALSVLPLAYWAAQARGAMRWVPPAAILAGLTLPVLLAGLPPVHWSEWAAAGLGVVAGWAAQRGAAYLERRCGSPSANEFSSP